MLEYSNELSAKEYCELRAAVAWQPLIEEQAQSGLYNSDFIIACRDDGDIVGCARIFWDKGYIAYLADVMVKPEYQGKGIGKALVAQIREDALAKGFDRLELNMWEFNESALAFYEALGFKTYRRYMDMVIT